MFAFFKTLSQQRMAWLLLILSCMALTITALYFQHNMGLQPCVMCIYERIALLGILIAGIFAMFAPKSRLLRWSAILFGLFCATKGLLLAIKHTDYQINPAPWNQCSPFVEFPATLPLDTWFPALFAAGGDCGKISWQFLGLSMPQWLIGIFAIYVLIFVLLLLSQFKRTQHTRRNLFR
ncbi:MAG: disulfide bond formation protein DsbB [Pasteurellaceae bacterium]|nr:disulfide bond formation protein DsbB [Pasteurellaceae bacterium]